MLAQPRHSVLVTKYCSPASSTWLYPSLGLLLISFSAVPMFVSNGIPVLGLPDPPRLRSMASTSRIRRASPRRRLTGTWSPGKNNLNSERGPNVCSRNFVDEEGFYNERLSQGVLLRHSIRVLPDRLIIERLRPHSPRTNAVPDAQPKPNEDPNEAPLHSEIYELGGRPIYPSLQKAPSIIREATSGTTQSPPAGEYKRRVFLLSISPLLLSWPQFHLFFCWRGGSGAKV